MLVGVVLARLFGVMFGVDVVAVRHVCVMTGLLMVARGVMLGSRAMMLGGVFMVLCGFQMMLGAVFGHLCNLRVNDTERA